MILPLLQIIAFAAVAFYFGYWRAGIRRGRVLANDSAIKASEDSQQNRNSFNGSELGGPPKNARFLFWLVRPENRECLQGDLDEEYTIVLLPRYGQKIGRFLYWWHAVRSCIICFVGALRSAFVLVPRR